MLSFTHSLSGGCFSLQFSDKPNAAIRSTLKAHGFRWSPAGGNWWRGNIRGAADFLEGLQRQIYREEGVRPPPDGACWDCKSPDGYFRNYGAATPVRCDACEAKRKAEYAAENARYDAIDRAYEDDCARRCGL